MITHQQKRMTSSSPLPILRNKIDKKKTEDFAVNIIVIIYFIITIVVAYTASRLLQTIINQISFEDEHLSKVDYNENWSVGERKLLECLYIVPASIFTIWYAVKGADKTIMKGRMDNVSTRSVLIVQSWSILLFSMFGLVITYANEPIISSPIIIFTLTTCFCGYFILEPYMVTCFHILSTLAWSGMFDLCFRTNSWSELRQYPFQCLLACMLIFTNHLRAMLQNNELFNNNLYQYVGIPIMLLLYWCFEIPGCELLSTYFEKQVTICEFSQNLQISGAESNFELFLIILVFQVFHLCLGRLSWLLLVAECSEENEILSTSDNTRDEGALLNHDTVAATKLQRQQKRASRSAHRLEGGRVNSRDRAFDREKTRADGHSCRAASDSISSSDSDDSCSTTSYSTLSTIATTNGPLGESKVINDAQRRGGVASAHAVMSAKQSTSDFLPTLSLLSTLPLLSSFSIPFTSAATNDDSKHPSSEQPLTPSSALPSTTHLLNSLPVLSPTPAFNFWGFSMNDSVADSAPSTPTRPVMTSTSLSTVSCDVNGDIMVEEEITEEEAYDIVQKGLLHVKSLRAN